MIVPTSSSGNAVTHRGCVVRMSAIRGLGTLIKLGRCPVGWEKTYAGLKKASRCVIVAVFRKPPKSVHHWVSEIQPLTPRPPGEPLPPSHFGLSFRGPQDSPPTWIWWFCVQAYYVDGPTGCLEKVSFIHLIHGLMVSRWAPRCQKYLPTPISQKYKNHDNAGIWNGLKRFNIRHYWTISSYIYRTLIGFWWEKYCY